MSKTTNRTIVVSSILGLNVGVGYYTSIADIDTDSGKTNEALRLANVYMGQKGALVDARTWLYEQIQWATGFAADATKNKTVDVKDTKGVKTGTKVVNTETEGEYIKRFIASIDAGTFTPVAGAPIDGKNPPDITGLTKGTATTWTQALLDSHGAFNNDASAVERSGKPKSPAQFALKAAESVFHGERTGKPPFTELERAAIVKKHVATLAKAGFPITITGDVTADKLAFAWAVQKRDDKAREDAAAKEFAIV